MFHLHNNSNVSHIHIKMIDDGWHEFGLNWTNHICLPPTDYCLQSIWSIWTDLSSKSLIVLFGVHKLLVAYCYIYEWNWFTNWLFAICVVLLIMCFCSYLISYTMLIVFCLRVSYELSPLLHFVLSMILLVVISVATSAVDACLSSQKPYISFPISKPVSSHISTYLKRFITKWLIIERAVSNCYCVDNRTKLFTMVAMHKHTNTHIVNKSLPIP